MALKVSPSASWQATICAWRPSSLPSSGAATAARDATVSVHAGERAQEAVELGGVGGQRLGHQRHVGGPAIHARPAHEA
jgi:hypothetical protein